MDYKSAAKLVSEAGLLKFQRRTGFWYEGLKDPESIADHTFRAVLIDYVLAKMEGADEGKVMKMVLFHDLPEARLGDLNAVNKRYINADEAEKKIIEEQASLLPDGADEEAKSLLKEFNEQKTEEAKIARDADKIELLATVKEYVDVGYKGLEHWAKVHPTPLTESGRKLLDELQKLKVGEWKRDLENRESL